MGIRTLRAQIFDLEAFSTNVCNRTSYFAFRIWSYNFNELSEAFSELSEAFSSKNREFFQSRKAKTKLRTALCRKIRRKSARDTKNSLKEILRAEMIHETENSFSASKMEDKPRCYAEKDFDLERQMRPVLN